MTSRDQQRVERSIVLYLLDSDHPEPWTLDALAAELPDVGPLAVREFAAQLAAAGVVVLDGERVTASPAARKLDSLDLIGA